MGDRTTTSRRRLGAWYTPDDVVGGLLDLAFEPVLADRRADGVDAVAALRVLDPSCGDGAFLVAAGIRIHRTLVDLGVEDCRARRTAFGRCVVGVDVDPGAVDACRRRLAEAGSEDPSDRVVEADALLASDDDWSALLAAWEAPGGVDAVLGNPPFLNPLAYDTSAGPERAAALQARFGDAARGYANPASLFLVLAGRLAARRGSVVSLVQPLSLLATRGAAATRSTVLHGWGLDALWVAGERVFDAAVDVCAPLLRPSSPATGTRTRLVVGRGFDDLGTTHSPLPDDATWSDLLVTVRGVPDVALCTGGVLDDVAAATADFRDQYYGLAGHLVDAETGDATTPRLLTAALVDPAHDRWGEASTLVLKDSWTHPRVRLDGLSVRMRQWADARLVPKVMVATQTRVLEAVVDDDGVCLPSVPLVSVVPVDGSPADVWGIAAVLTSPPAAMVAARRHLGAALSSDALKLGARDMAALPLPAEHGPWVEAAGAFRAASTATDPGTRRTHLLACGHSMCAAYGVRDSEPLLAWWEGRLPDR